MVSSRFSARPLRTKTTHSAPSAPPSTFNAPCRAYAREIEGYVDNFQLRVGLHSGTVVVGNVGSDLHFEYLAIGDAVNLAARLQSAAEPGTVLISDATAKQVRPAFELQDLGAISVKGKAEPIHVFQALAPKVTPESGRGIEGLSSPLVGRDKELAHSTHALAALEAGRGQIVSILGEAGIGKTRLVHEASALQAARAKQAASAQGDERRVRFIEGRALSYGQTLSFWTITQLLLADLGLTEGDPEPKLRVALRRRVRELFGERAADILPYLSHLLGVKLEGDAAERVRILDGETLKRQVLLSINDYFSKLAQQQPTVLVLEDFHWADPSSIDAVERLLRATQTRAAHAPVVDARGQGPTAVAHH